MWLVGEQRTAAELFATMKYKTRVIISSSTIRDMISIYLYNK